jgi:hypothetical protein
VSHVNFLNQPTYHFYRFLATSPGSNVDEMLDAAIDQAATDLAGAITWDPLYR